MSSRKSEYMLKYQKAKVKLLEYDVPKENYPKFSLNYRDLAFPTVLTLSEYAEAVINDDEERKDALKEGLHFCAEFYDAAMKSREQINHDLDFLLSGSIAYFFQEDYGSAVVLLSEIDYKLLPDDMRGTIAEVFNIIFYGKRKTTVNNRIVVAFEKYIQSGYEDQFQVFTEYDRCRIYGGTDAKEAFFTEALYAAIRIAISNSARVLLPKYSKLDANKWESYFNKNNSIKMVWPAQKLIGEQRILQGKSAIIQLPTGVGKTKSIELIVRSMFLSERGNVALIVAPLRSLCNEITDNMRDAFVNEAIINQFSDILELDFEEIFVDEVCNRVLICTPEKLQFIFHHQPDFLSEINLFIFDEGHMFDDMSRGAMYELLISDIKRNIEKTQQMIILSAVLLNADKILEWVIGDEGVLAYNEKIKSTPKVVGFASKENEIHYYSDSFTEEDFYIPRAIKQKELKTKRANGSPKLFPENKSQDIALYYTNQLCKNGGIAIYMSQRRSVPTILKRLIEISEKEYDLSRLRDSSNQNELRKLNKLISEYYGFDYVYAKASLLGILPHYSTLPNGVRLSVEHAFREKKIKAVACTSTLAQGVNIPIKYMIMTNLKSAEKMISSRNFQNLIGRTARSGVYTEGSILITDTKLFDERKNGRGYYKWQDAVKMIDPRNAEACGSAILSIVQDFTVNYELKVPGKFVSDFICDHICEEWDMQIVKMLIEGLKKIQKDTQLNINTITDRVAAYHNIIGTVENEICYVISNKTKGDERDKIEVDKAIDELYQSTLAFFLANDTEKELLHNIFKALVEKIKKQAINIDKLAISMVDIDMASEIIELIEGRDLNNTSYHSQELIIFLVDLYNQIYQHDLITNDLCIKWINGYSYAEIGKDCDIAIMDVEKKCGLSLSYQLSFLIGNIIDYLDAESENYEKLLMIQKQIKYGVKSTTSISICEKVFNDRIVSNLITEIIGNALIEEDKIINVIRYFEDTIISELQEYPSFFTDRIRFLNKI